MYFMRTVMGVTMNGSRWWLTLAVLALLLAASSGRHHHHHHRRSMPTQPTIPLSKSGWRPVIGSGGVLYGTFAGSHQNPSYKIPVPVLDLYQSSSRPLVARDATKLTSIAQSYRPTTIRTVSSAPPAPPANQPINSYHNPFAFPNNGFTYKYIQNFPLDSVLIRNPQNPYAARPVFSKYPAKIKPPYHNSVLQQLTNIQPIHFGQYQANKPLDIFGKPVESYARPTEPSKQSHGTEIFKPEVFKLSDSDTASQSINQQVKTAQQTFVGTPKTPSYSHYAFQDSFPPSILGTFGSFGVQSVKARDPVFPSTKTTYLPPQPTKQTIFNSFSFSPSFKTPAVFSSTTPKLQTTLNQLNFGFNDFKTPTQQTKVSVPAKIDPNAQTKVTFKPSPQDPFTNKHFISDYNKVVVTTYNPIQTTTLGSKYFDFGFPPQQSAPNHNQNFYTYDTKKQKIHDSFTAGGHQVVSQVPQHYTSPPKQDINSVSSRPTYEVIETTDSADEIITHSSPPAWTYQSYDNPKSTEQSVTKQYLDSIYGNPTSTAAPDLPEEYAIVTEGEKGYQNSLNYDGQVETQSRRPLGDDFEPIGKHKLKDYYYKVSTVAYDTDQTTARRTKKPTDGPNTEVTTTHFDLTNDRNNENPTEALPTLPPNQHFKRPNSQEPLDKDKIRKRIKNRRRRPPLANLSNSTSTTTRKYYHTTTETPSLQTTEPEETHTFKPRVRPFKLKGQPNLTTPSVTTDLTTSALPTISPTIPTLVKKKLVRRPHTTTTERLETTTQVYRDSESSNDSPIMKIANRPSYSKLSQSYEYRSGEAPDYSHKQDEKDTPTSDVAVNLSETTVRDEADQTPAFAFHKDVKPIEAKLETTTESVRGTEAPSEATTTSGRVQRPRLKNKFNRPKFSVKDYRNRLNSTTSTTEKIESTSKVRFPQRKVPNTDNYFNSDIEVTTERKKFMPKDPRHKSGNNSENNEQNEKEIHSIRPQRTRPTVETTEAVTQKISARIRNGQRRPKPTEEYTETTPTAVHNKRPLRKKIKDSNAEETQDVAVTETTVHYDKNAFTSERTRSESAIMKIADKKHQDHHLEHVFEHSKRVSDLTLAASKDYNTPGMFKTVSSNSRRIPNYFTIATDDPILPIEAFFPQLNQKKES